MDAETREHWTFFEAAVARLERAEARVAELEAKLTNLRGLLHEEQRTTDAALARADRLATVLRMVEGAIEEDGWHDYVDDQAHTVAELVIHEVREAPAAAHQIFIRSKGTT